MSEAGFEPAPPSPADSPALLEGTTARALAQRYAPKKALPSWVNPKRRTPWRERVRDAAAWAATIAIAGTIIWLAATVLVDLPIQGERPFVARQ